MLSTQTGQPGDVMLWCETDMLCKAEAVFELLETHRERLGIEHLALMDRDSGKAISSSGSP